MSSAGRSVSRALRLCSQSLSSWRIAGVSCSDFKRLPSAPASVTVGGPRFLSISPLLLSATPADLDKAKEKVTTLSEDPGNDVKLKLYGLYKQATIGTCNTDKPGMTDFVGRAKWNAWNSLGALSQSEAIDEYCKLVDELVSADKGSGASSGDAPTATPTESEATSNKYEQILVSQEGGALTITLNRPSKYNAITYQMYGEIQQVLQEAGGNDSVVLVVITGAGEYYCSGNDLSNFMNIPPEGPEKLAAHAKTVLRDFVAAFINFPKPLIAAVNGPAIGISVTTLALCDLVYAADNATFHTPFMSLGQSPEACSSLLFPQIMGVAKANEVLLGGRKLSADEACERNLVSQVFPAAHFREKVQEIVSSMAKLPLSMSKSKQLIRDGQREQLETANILECELLEERWLSDECRDAIIRFMQRKN